jgi:hypothetical protein
MSRHIRRAAASVVAVVLLGAAGASPRAQSVRLPLRFTAMATNLSANLSFPRQTPIQIVINRWSTDGEQEQLTTVLTEKGTDGLLEMLQKAGPAGSMRTPDTVNLDFHFAMWTPAEDGGQNITLITDRPVGFLEAYERPLSMDFRFMVLSLQVSPVGRGEGRISVATKIWVDRILGDIQMQPYETDFIMLKDLRRVR